MALNFYLKFHFLKMYDSINKYFTLISCKGSMRFELLLKNTYKLFLFFIVIRRFYRIN